MGPASPGIYNVDRPIRFIPENTSHASTVASRLAMDSLGAAGDTLAGFGAAFRRWLPSQRNNHSPLEVGPAKLCFLFHIWYNL